MSFASRIKNFEFQKLAPTAFYGIVGIIFLVLLPLADFPPHVALTGVLNLIAAYGIFKKRFWALWLVVALFAVATTISFYTLYVIAFTNWIVALSMITYAVLTWLFTFNIYSKRKSMEN